MKLVDRFVFCFLAIFLVSTPMSIYITNSNIKQHIDAVEIARLKAFNATIATQIAAGADIGKYLQGKAASAELFNGPLPAQTATITRQKINHDEERVDVTLFRQIGGKNYKISSYNYVPQAPEILQGMVTWVTIKTLLVAIAVVITARILSRRLLSPFNQTIKQIQHFNIRNKKPLALSPGNIKEFKELNHFLQSMTDKAIKEYGQIKEFSENASHELQTPLAVLRSKLELFAETDIQDNQAAIINDMHNAVAKLSRINHSLLLLTKLENEEYEANKPIPLSKHINDIISFYEERIQMNELVLSTAIDTDVFVKIHPALADMLFDNLLSNAVRHNTTNGNIYIALTATQLLVQNTGVAPSWPTDELFLRFKKGNQCNSSIGLGLAIVKQICDLNKFTIAYTYNNGVHTIKVNFASSKPVAKTAVKLSAQQSFA